MTFLETENDCVLTLVQALVGAVSPNFRRVSLHLADDRVRLRFVLERDSEEDRDEIEDIAFVFESQLSGPADVEVEVIVDAGPLPGLEPGERVVYGRRET